MARTVADQLWEMLANAGVRRCYGIVGDALNPVTDALRRSGRVEFTHVRHEEYGAFAAAAEAQLTGRPVAVCGAAGPGAAHLVNGLIDAKHESAPVIAIAGDVTRATMDTDALQELNPYHFFQPASLYTARVVAASQARAVFQTAVTTALLEHGPVVISLPSDVARAAAKPGWAETHAPRVDPAPPRPHEQDLAAMAEIINSANAVTVFAGYGVKGAAAEVAAFADLVQAPVVFTLRGKQFVEGTTRNAVGMTGLLGWGGAPGALHQADLVVLLGCDFPYTDYLPDAVPAIQVDKSPAHIGRRMPVSLGVVGDVGGTLRGLLPRLRVKTDGAHLARHLAETERWRSRLRGCAAASAGRTPIRPEHLAAVISELAAEDAIFTVDTGTPCLWAARHIQGTGKRRIIGSLSWSSMASAAPYGFGAALAEPDRQVIALCGDGGFTMLGLGDLITQVRYGARVVNVVFNNQQLDFVNIEQREAGYPLFGADLPNPDLAGVATALGAHGIRVTDPAAVRGAVRDALAFQDGPVVLDVVVGVASDRTHGAVLSPM
ncbi:MAG: ubiquinone-dependent pyruvate dehydrogenase [Bifidobacteriaceae bacterium]|jgi:pyruvate dehydrogenase (quinone)|nr:ubiquinone-dependent pyruvate dehydrogenase [Bifidobacteriaceae bacterium]